MIQYNTEKSQQTGIIYESLWIKFWSKNSDSQTDAKSQWRNRELLDQVFLQMELLVCSMKVGETEEMSP